MSVLVLVVRHGPRSVCEVANQEQPLDTPSIYNRGKISYPSSGSPIEGINSMPIIYSLSCTFQVMEEIGETK